MNMPQHLSKSRRVAQRPKAGRPFASMAPLRPRSMLFTLYGDYAFPHRQDVWLGSLVRIADVLGITAVAVRSAVARLARERWLVVRKSANRSHYALSARGQTLIEEGTRRIYRADGEVWDGQWFMLTYSIPEGERTKRDRIRKRLAFLGFGSMGGGVHIAARAVADDVERLLQTQGAAQFARTFHARTASGSDHDVVEQCWDLPRIAQEYRRFIEHYRPLCRRAARLHQRGRLKDAHAFALRFALTHDFRRFPFIDPDLPHALLPSGWPGTVARRLFNDYHGMLAPAAERFFASATR
ncbi:MAG: hypothetical protein DLM53_05520 [Candidatus Eremiobacter antarcticus]|nr:MAG: hypothetical protein DLM53_05520 [Candidatus Eremiobacter sp. RRmetagenome_bin22]